MRDRPPHVPRAARAARRANAALRCTHLGCLLRFNSAELYLALNKAQANLAMARRDLASRFSTWNDVTGLTTTA